MEPVTVFLGLGSNVGDRERHLRDAIRLLGQSLDLRQTSSLYETKPWGYRNQPTFLNVVCQAQTPMSPDELLSVCQEVEQRLGRKPTFRYGPRVLDVDILSYGDQVVATPDLVVPHPRLAERAFVLVPLAEIAPDWRHPLLGKSAMQLKGAVTGTEGMRLFKRPLEIPSEK